MKRLGAWFLTLFSLFTLFSFPGAAAEERSLLLRPPFPLKNARACALSRKRESLSGAAPALPAKSALPGIDAAGYALMEAEGKALVASKNADLRLPPASTTKIMTCLVIAQTCDPGEEVTVAPEACGVEGSSAYLRPGQRLSVKELLYCLMLASANDAAAALALHAAGDLSSFAALMNEKASALGMKNTHFANPHGLPEEGHFSSAYDLALLMACALNDPLFAEIAKTKRITVGSGENARTLTNHNRLLFTLEGCIGGKTGYTVRAGRCLVSACRKNGTTLIVSTLSCRDDWAAHEALYAYGFSAVSRRRLEEERIFLPFSSGDPLPVRHGEFSCLVSASDSLEFHTVCPSMLFAPVKEGEKVGYISVRLNGREIGQADLICDETREAPVKKGLIARFISLIVSFFKKRSS